MITILGDSKKMRGILAKTHGKKIRVFLTIVIVFRATLHKTG